MIANYHTHTWRCMHASGTEREYVEHAIECGLKILGFSDHTPQAFPEGYVSGIRMKMQELENYVDTIIALKKEYEKDIEIHLGLEVEYYPQLFDKLVEEAAKYPIEYFILGQHTLGNEIGEPYCGTKTTDETILKRYCAQVKEAMATGCFTYLAHPDLINFVGDGAVYEEQIRSLCLEAQKQKMPLEINLWGLHEGKPYPRKNFWKIAGQVGNQTIFGIDAHEISCFHSPQLLVQAKEMTKELNLQVIDTVEFKDFRNHVM